MRDERTFREVMTAGQPEPGETRKTPKPVEAPLLMREWLFVLLVLSVPVVNPILPILWAIGTPKTRLKTFARGFLVVEAIAVLFYILFWRLAPDL